ncbi:MAG: tetratricopeptide repeat protein, partial [Myxococcales bacterium]|nr:tetratricopeptide repeat protein [Myxococcales bacterium]
VRVMDFGLVRAEQREPGDGARSQAPRGTSASKLNLELTSAGTVMGTPAFMAPEQFLAEPVDERTDLFSLCATMWVALYGQRAFPGTSFHQLQLAITMGQRRAPPRSSVPNWLRRVLERGLEREPARRHASVRALLEALEADPTPRRRVLVGALGVAAGAALWAALAQLQQRRARASCAADGQRIAELWNADARAALRGHMEGSGTHNAEETFTRLAPALDTWTAAWSETRAQLCVAVKVERTLDAELGARALDCSESQRAEFAALYEVLATGERATAVEAVAAATRLPRSSRCADPERLRLLTLPAPEQREAAWALRERLLRAQARGLVRDDKQALALAEEVLVEADALGWSRLITDAELEICNALTNLGRFDEAEEHGLRGLHLALSTGLDGLAVDAAVKLGFVAHERVEFKRGLAWMATAAALVARSGDSPHETRMLDVNGLLLTDVGKLDEARRAYERGLELKRETLGEDSLELASPLNNLARVEFISGDLDKGLALTERAQEIYERALGPNHPRLAITLYNRGAAYARRHDYATARPLLERGVSIYERAYGPESPKLASSLSLLGFVLVRLGEVESGLALGDRALAIQRQSFGAEHPKYARALANRGTMLLNLERLEEARALHQEALAILERNDSRSDPVASSHSNLGEIALKLGRPDEAAAHLERAIELREALGSEPRLLAVSRFQLARALESRDPERALASAERAQEVLAGSDISEAKELEKWLAGHKKPQTRKSKQRRRGR